eukprot:5825872-Prymnesium_polylepis.1
MHAARCVAIRVAGRGPRGAGLARHVRHQPQHRPGIGAPHSDGRQRLARPRVCLSMALWTA